MSNKNRYNDRNQGGSNQRHSSDFPQRQHSPSDQGGSQQAWPRQQQLPGNPGSWNRNQGDQRRHQQQNQSASDPQQNGSHHQWQKNDSRRRQPSNQRQQQQQPLQQQPSKQQIPREFKPPPPRPNAWGQAASLPTPQQPQSMPSSTATQQTSQSTERNETAPTNASVSPQTIVEKNQGSMGAWGTKLKTKEVITRNSAKAQESQPVDLKPEPVPAPLAKKTKNKHQANKKDNHPNNSSTNANKKIHGKKPKLSNLSMGDLVPKIKKIMPREKNKTNANQKTKSINLATASADFPALPTSSNWPSLNASRVPAEAAARSPVKQIVTPKPATPNNNNNMTNNATNNSQSKKRKTQSQQQSSDSKKGVATKGKNGAINNLMGINNNSKPAKPDENHLAAQFLLPPGKSLDPHHMQAQLRHPGLIGGELDFQRMVQGGHVVKGRQRIKPRKKRFTALKRKILLERLRVWKELHPEDGGETNGDSSKGKESSCTVCVRGFASLEELDDSDEFEELLQNLSDMAEKMGIVRYIFIPRSLVKEDSAETGEHPVFVHFSTPAEAMAARGVWDGLVIGGQSLKVSSVTFATNMNVSMDEGGPTEDAWQKACLEAVQGESCQPPDVLGSSTFQIVLKDVLTEDDLEDDECFAESIRDIKEMVEKFGIVEDVQCNKQQGQTDVVVVYKGDQSAAQTVLESLQNLTLGGSQLNAELLLQEPTHCQHLLLLLDNILTEDDLEDEECLEESLCDVRSMLEKFGSISKLDAIGKQIQVSFDVMDPEALQSIAIELNNTSLAGQTIKASVLMKNPPISDAPAVLLRNVLTEDDMNDDECLEESIEDIRELARQYGTIDNIIVERGDDVANAVVKVTYSALAEAEEAMKHFHGMIVGGETISASLSSPISGIPLEATENLISDTDERTPDDPEGETKPMFSGDKRIPERFAACKRVPKVPNKGVPRHYAILTNNETVKPLLVEMLNELMRLQLRALNDKNAKNAKARRRVVIGLREVARGIRANKVKMVVMANNLDEYGAIDDKLQEILDLAAEKEIPVLFELSKRVLGKSLGKKIKVSVAAIQATDGAHQQFVKLSNLAPKLEKSSPSLLVEASSPET